MLARQAGCSIGVSVGDRVRNVNMILPRRSSTDEFFFDQDQAVTVGAVP